ncbi:matrixin family metalloprotease [Polyangium aurulentum]|uniref:matrixin family metalloprotease n=1 Tax=Polyangium aurulentum TaxID=2567896 RepID=UPI0010AE8F6A|nr:matrixin family metalloprotease [Polyangium aurulentum]UQA63006.1 matrixin family metalloprotease [Polyangium aurulentum]
MIAPRAARLSSWIAILLVCVLSPAGAARAFEQERSEYGARERLSEGPVRVRLAAPVPGSPDGGKEALRRAMTAWGAPACTSLRFVEASDFEPADVEVRFVKEGWPYGRAIAAHTDVQSDAQTGAIGRVVIEISGAWTWGEGEALPAGALDLESVLLHELGHAAGFSHSRDPDAMMRAGIKPGVVRRALAEDDVEGVCAIYPASGPAALRARSVVKRAPFAAGAVLGVGGAVLAGLVVARRRRKTSAVRRPDPESSP